MAVVNKIVFSSDEHTLKGEELEEVRDERVKEARVKIPELSVDAEKIVRDGIVSCRTNEKNILTSLTENVLSFKKDLKTYNSMATLIEEIENAEGELIIAKSDMSLLQESFTKMKEIPGIWLRYNKLISQLDNPEDITVEV